MRARQAQFLRRFISKDRFSEVSALETFITNQNIISQE